MKGEGAHKSFPNNRKKGGGAVSKVPLQVPWKRSYSSRKGEKGPRSDGNAPFSRVPGKEGRKSFLFFINLKNREKGGRKDALSSKDIPRH